MDKKYHSFSRRLSKRILTVIVATVALIAILVMVFDTILLRSVINAYYMSEVQVANESIEKRLYEDEVRANLTDSLYTHMQELDEHVNELNPETSDNPDDKRNKHAWVYNIVIDSLGNYLYHPDRQRIGKGNFFDDISLSSDAERSELALGLASDENGHLEITIDGVSSYMFYTRLENTNWRNAIIVPTHGLVFLTLVTLAVILLFLTVGLLLTYWVSRITIRRSTQPLQLLAKSADEVAKGNFHAPLPELTHNDEICHLRDSFSNMQQSLTQYIDQLKATTAQKAAIESELSIARDIQLSKVPREFPARPDVDIYASMTPAKAVGGDLYDFFIRDDQLIFCIGDVSGKGVPAALFMMEARSLFRAYASGDLQPDRIVTKINHDLNQNNDTCMFVTLFVGVLDLTSGLLRYCSAGHEPPVIIGREARQLPVDHIFPVGALAETPYRMQTVVLEPQSIILFYTDGLTEAMNADGQLFGKKRIFSEVERAIHDGQPSPKALIDRLTQAVRQFAGDTEQSDDLTMLAIMIAPAGKHDMKSIINNK